MTRRHRTERTLGLAVLVVGLAALFTPSALGHGPNADFSYSPTSPSAGEQVTFTATPHSPHSTEPGVTFAYDWDFDNDGQFDDDTGGSVTRTFPAGGNYLVRLRARENHGGTLHGENVVEKTVTVSGEPPPPSPPPPAENQAPTARMKLGCIFAKAQLSASGGSPGPSPGGAGAQGCIAAGTQPGLTARQFKPRDLDAGNSSDADGQIVKYEWDLDYNGSFEKAGSSPVIEHTFTKLGKRTIRVQVTDDGGATDTTEVTVIVVPPKCEPEVKFARLHAVSQCFRKTAAGWKSKDPITVNGILVDPGNRSIHLSADSPYYTVSGLLAKKIKVYVPVKGVSTLIHNGPVSWRLDGHELDNFKANGKINGLKISGMPERPKLNSDKKTATLKFNLEMPERFAKPGFAPPTSDGPIAVKTAPGAQIAADFEFKVEDAYIGPIQLKELSVKYTGPYTGPDGTNYADFWEINAHVKLPDPIPYDVKAGAGIEGGAFAYGYADVDNLNVGPLPYAIYLQRIKFGIAIKPKPNNPAVKECIPKIGVHPYTLADFHSEQGFPIPPGFDAIFNQPLGNKTKDWGTPNFALCGAIALSLGPSIGGVSMVRLDTGLGLAFYPDRPHMFRMFGELSLVGIPLSKSSLEIHTDGYVRMESVIDAGLDDVAHLYGGMFFTFYYPKFNAEMLIEACLDFADICAGAHGLVSSKGIATCLKISLIFVDWTPGFGYQWGGDFDLYFTGCDVGPYREKINHKLAKAGKPQVRAAKTEEPLQIKPGLPGFALTATGQGAPPKITLEGPNGERVTTPDDNKAVQEKPFLLIKDPRPDKNTTNIAIGQPAGGNWKLIVEDGSAPVVKIEQSEGLPKPDVKAKVTGRGHQRKLDFDVKRLPGQTVRFVEDGPSAGGLIGTDVSSPTGAGKAYASHGKAHASQDGGKVDFKPADGVAETRSVYAVVEQDGFMRAKIPVAKFRAPGPLRPAKPRVRVKLRGSRLKASWNKVRGAESYLAAVKLSDGRTLYFPTKRRSVKVSKVPHGGRATVTVLGISKSKIEGRKATVKVKPARGRGRR